MNWSAREREFLSKYRDELEKVKIEEIPMILADSELTTTRKNIAIGLAIVLGLKLVLMSAGSSRALTVDFNGNRLTLFSFSYLLTKKPGTKEAEEELINQAREVLVTMEGYKFPANKLRSLEIVVS